MCPACSLPGGTSYGTQVQANAAATAGVPEPSTPTGWHCLKINSGACRLLHSMYLCSHLWVSSEDRSADCVENTCKFWKERDTTPRNNNSKRAEVVQCALLGQAMPTCPKNTQGRQMGHRESCEHCSVKSKLCQGCQVSKVWQRYSATAPMVQDSERGREHGAKGPKIPWLPNHLQAATCMLTSNLKVTPGICCATHLGPVFILLKRSPPVKRELLQPW